MMDSKTRDDRFPKEIQLAAQHSQRKHGVPACVTLAQWALESNYGKAMSGKNNPFGIKGKPGTLCPTWEVINGRPQRTQAYFKNFPTVEAAFNYHGHMLMRPDGYYKAAHPYAHSETWEMFIKKMAPTYATDPSYAGKLTQIIKNWGLHYLNLSPEEEPE